MGCGDGRGIPTMRVGDCGGAVSGSCRVRREELGSEAIAWVVVVRVEVFEVQIIS